MSDALSARVESSTSVAPPLAEVALLQESGVLGLSLAGSPFSLSICLERRCRTLQSTATPWELRIGAGSEYLSRISSSATTDWFIRAASTQSLLLMVAEEQRNGVLCVWGEENGIIYVMRGFCRCQFTALLSFFFSFFLSFFCLGPHTCWRATVHFSLVSFLLPLSFLCSFMFSLAAARVPHALLPREDKCCACCGWWLCLTNVTPVPNYIFLIIFKFDTKIIFIFILKFKLSIPGCDGKNRSKLLNDTRSKN